MSTARRRAGAEGTSHLDMQPQTISQQHFAVAPKQSGVSPEHSAGSRSEQTRPDNVHLSIVIPAFNEAQRLPESLAAMKDYLDQRPLSSEVIIVDDGSTDGTDGIVKAWRRHWPMLRLVRGAHRGKGGAVRTGVLVARGKYVALADADFSMPVQDLDGLTGNVMDTCDVAIGSREAPGARRHSEPWYRYLMSRVFNRVVQTLLLPGIQDTQCGFKCLRRHVAVDLCQHQTIDGWGFDPELLYIARRRGYRVREAPISWHYKPGSRVNPLRDAFGMIRELMVVRANGLRGVYDR